MDERQEYDDRWGRVSLRYCKEHKRPEAMALGIPWTMETGDDGRVVLCPDPRHAAESILALLQRLDPLYYNG